MGSRKITGDESTLQVSPDHPTTTTHTQAPPHTLIHAQAPLTHILALGPGAQTEVSGPRVSMPSLRQEEGVVQG